jgi:aspartate/methionine/tyrosine aminotransferase
MHATIAPLAPVRKTAASGRFEGLATDLYSAVYAVLDDAKTRHRLVKLYKGSHLSLDPHHAVSGFGEYFARHRRGLLGYACAQINPDGPPEPADLAAYDAAHQPRIPTQQLFDEIAASTGHAGESPELLLGRLAGRTHHLGAYRGGSSGYDEEARAVAALHFRQLGIPSRPGQVLVSCGGAKGHFLAFCAALMCRRRFNQLDHDGGIVLAPEGFYQSLRLIPAIFGGTIDTLPRLTGPAVHRRLIQTAHHPNRALYVPVVNNATGEVLDTTLARDVATAVLAHNSAHRANPVFVLGDDVYAGSYLDPHLTPTPIGAVAGMSDWTVSVVSPSKTFALPTSRIAFATTTNRQLAAAMRHYRTVLAHGRTPQVTELAAAAALALTPHDWIDQWNHRYRRRLTTLTTHLTRINRELGDNLLDLRLPQGGWYVQLRIARRAFPIPITSSIDAFAILLHYQPDQTDSGLGLLPGELFGTRLRPTDRAVTLRATLAVTDADLTTFTTRLRDALQFLAGEHGPAICQQALHHARTIADFDTILTHTSY